MYRSPHRVPAGWRPAEQSGRRLVQLDRIAVRVGDLHLFAPRTDGDVGAQRHARPAQTINPSLEVVDIEHDPVPTAGHLLLAVHRSGPRAGRSAQNEIQSPTRDDRDGSGALLEAEGELAGVELDPAIEISHLIAHYSVREIRGSPRHVAARRSVFRHTHTVRAFGSSLKR